MPRTYEKFEGKVSFTSSSTPNKSTTYRVEADIALFVNRPKSAMICTIRVEGGPHVTFEVATPNVSLPPRWRLGMSLKKMVEAAVTLHRHATCTVQVSWE